MGGGRTFHARKSFAASFADDKRGRWPWPELLPANPFTHIPPSVETEMWFKNLRSSPAITKSKLPTTTRCSNAHQRSQLIHVITGKATNPTAGVDRGRPSQFLGDSAIDVQAMYKAENSSYWSVLQADTCQGTMPEIIRTPPAVHYTRFDPLDLQMTLRGISGPTVPSSGLVIDYTVSRSYMGSLDKFVSIRHECTTTDPFDPKKKRIEFTNSVVRSQGKVYAISLQGTLVVMQLRDDGRYKITDMSAIRAIPSSNWRFFKEYLVEMNGEVFLVFLINENSLAVVDRVEVFRLDLVKLRWIKVERLEGKTFFLKEKCIWVDSSEFGCRDNCVYFNHKSDDSWKVYDMKNDSISDV